MALQKTTNTNFGVSGNYIKIVFFSGDSENVTFEVMLYLNAASRNSNKLALIPMGSYVIPTPSTNMLPALYAHLKSLPEFAAAVDV